MGIKLKGQQSIKVFDLIENHIIIFNLIKKSFVTDINTLIVMCKLILKDQADGIAEIIDVFS